MSDTGVGITVASNEVTLVVLEFLGNSDCILLDDTTWKLQQGARPDAYNVMYNRLLNYLNENSINHVAIKASALSRGTVTFSHLQAAELRGVIIAAAAQSSASIQLLTKAHISRTFGERKVDEYIADEGFWDTRLPDVTNLRKGSRETALLVFAVRRK
jgi:hypothetical protein